jgi:hypothetical protein
LLEAKVFATGFGAVVGAPGWLGRLSFFSSCSTTCPCGARFASTEPVPAPVKVVVPSEVSVCRVDPDAARAGDPPLR